MPPWWSLLFADVDAYPRRYREPDKADPALGGGPDAWPVPYWFVDSGFAALVLLLGAVDAGLGACFLGNFRGEEALRTALGVPGDRHYVGAVLIGAPDGGDAPSASVSRPRRDPARTLHRGRW